jgi:hypothetical protein
MLARGTLQRLSQAVFGPSSSLFLSKFTQRLHTKPILAMAAAEPSTETSSTECKVALCQMKVVEVRSAPLWCCQIPAVAAGLDPRLQTPQPIDFLPHMHAHSAG